MWKFELKKILIDKKIIFIIVFVILFETLSLLSSYSFRSESLIENNKELYEYYIDIYGGEMSEEKKAKLDKEIERLEQIQQYAMDITDEYLKGQVTAAEVSTAKAQAYPYQRDIEILKVIQKQADYVMKSLDADTVIYENGWILLLGRAHTNYIIPVIIIFLFVPSVTERFEYGMDKMIYCCKNGRVKAFLHKMFSMFFVSVLLCILIGLIDILYFTIEYGLPNWMLPVKNISTFQNILINLPLIVHFLLLICQWIIGCIMLLSVSLFLGVTIKNSFCTIILELILMVLPTIVLEKEFLFKYFFPITFFVDGGYINGIETWQKALMVIQIDELIKGICFMSVIMIVCFFWSKIMINKKRNKSIFGLMICCLLFSGCGKVNIDKEDLYVNNSVWIEDTMVNGYHLYYDREILDYVIDINGKEMLLNNNPLSKISDSMSSIADIQINKDKIYYVVDMYKQTEMCYEVYEFDTNTINRQMIYTTQNNVVDYLGIDKKWKSQQYLRFQLLLVRDDFLVFSDTSGVFLYNRNTKKEENILTYASNVGVCKGEIYYIDKIGYLNSYNLDTKEIRKIIDKIINAYIPLKEGIIYIDGLDLKVKLYLNDNNIVLLEKETECMMLDGSNIKCVTYDGEEISIPLDVVHT